LAKGNVAVASAKVFKSALRVTKCFSKINNPI
jgi:hypothetical protein